MTNRHTVREFTTSAMALSEHTSTSLERWRQLIK